MVLPKNRIMSVNELGGISRGHFGINKTLKTIRNRFYWVGCRNCMTCDAAKRVRPRIVEACDSITQVYHLNK